VTGRIGPPIEGSTLVTRRRAMGALEAEVLEVLWRAKGAQTPNDVLAALDDDLAYTTVMTTLVRLHDKGLVERVKVGRSFSYSAVVSEADLVASRMQRELSRSSDRMASMSRFVDGLTLAEARQLRRLLEQPEP
jgi:predicted transcriptional regulator